jgi:hypothetical protein
LAVRSAPIYLLKAVAHCRKLTIGKKLVGKYGFYGSASPSFTAPFKKAAAHAPMQITFGIFARKNRFILSYRKRNKNFS